LAVPAPHPTFLIIGAERAATRWLRFNLDQHPDICAPALHLDYFSDPDLMATNGYRWYRQQFTSWNGEPFVGEASPSYMMWKNRPGDVARRIHKTVPDVRLIAIVRNPVDRLESALRHHIRWGRIAPGADLYSAIAASSPENGGVDLLGASVNFHSLYRFADRFGDQLQVLFYDDLVEDPAAFYRAALAHIGASTQFVPPDLDRVLFSDRNKADVPELTLEERRDLFQWFRQDVEQMSEWVGRDLSSWYPDGHEAADDLDLSSFFQSEQS
jgi:hypothetical protein